MRMLSQFGDSLLRTGFLSLGYTLEPPGPTPDHWLWTLGVGLRYQCLKFPVILTCTQACDNRTVRFSFLRKAYWDGAPSLVSVILSAFLSLLATVFKTTQSTDFIGHVFQPLTLGSERSKPSLGPSVLICCSWQKVKKHMCSRNTISRSKLWGQDAYSFLSINRRSMI